MDDLISRQNVLKEIDRACRKYPETFFVGFAISADIVAKQPTAERPKGKWISEYPVSVCSECDAQMLLGDFSNYCPNCGAEMEKQT